MKKSSSICPISTRTKSTTNSEINGRRERAGARRPVQIHKRRPHVSVSSSNAKIIPSERLGPDGKILSKLLLLVLSSSSTTNPSSSCWQSTWPTSTECSTVGIVPWRSFACTYQSTGRLYAVFLTSMPLMFQGTYGESVGVSGLNYLALGIGVTGASQINARAVDKIYKILTKRYGGTGQPEYRLRACCIFSSLILLIRGRINHACVCLASLVPGSIFLPVGLLMTGWAVQAKVHWIVPDIVRFFPAPRVVSCLICTML